MEGTAWNMEEDVPTLPLAPGKIPEGSDISCKS